MERTCVAFADGQAIVLGAGDGDPGADLLAALFEMGRRTLRRVREWAGEKAVFRHGRIEVGTWWSSVEAVHAELLSRHPISVQAGFEGNPGVEGGAWRPGDGGDDGLVHLRFAAGTSDLPLHVHEFSDRLLVVTSGMGLFHYAPSVEDRELRSIVVEAGDVVVFTRGLLHTFTAPIGEIVLLSYHSPFFELNDPRQFMIPLLKSRDNFRWQFAGLSR